MAMATRIIVRGSPDWKTFDLEQSRPFLKALNLPDSLIIDLASLWNSNFRIHYNDVRAELKELARRTLMKADASVESIDNFNASLLDPLDKIIFIDDDDWLSPEVFEHIEMGADDDAVLWPSLRIGVKFNTAEEISGVLNARLQDGTVYTNNYAVSGRAIVQYGPETLVEHYRVSNAFAAPEFRLKTTGRHLSAALKHHCSTMAAAYLMPQEEFRSDPRRSVRQLIEALAVAPIDAEFAWISEPLGEFIALMSDAMR